GPRDSELTDQGGDDLTHVADDRVVGPREDWGLRIGVDDQDAFRALAADHVLDRAADAAGDVEVGRDPGPGLADLIGVGSPAEARDRAGAAHDAPEELGQPGGR